MTSYMHKVVHVLLREWKMQIHHGRSQIRARAGTKLKLVVHLTRDRGMLVWALLFGLSSWRTISLACTAEEVELLACKEGLALAAEWVRMPLVLESDYTSVLNMLHAKNADRLKWHAVISEAKGQMQLIQGVRLQKIGKRV